MFYLFTELTLIGSPSPVFRSRVFDDVLFAKERCSADLAMIFPDCQRKCRIVKHGTVAAVVQRVTEL